MGAGFMRVCGFALLSASLLSLSGCAEFASLFEQKKPKTTTVKKAKPAAEISAQTYVTQLANGRLALMQSPPDTARAAEAAGTLRNFHTAKTKKATNPSLRVLTVEYSGKGSSKKREVIAPVDQEANYAALTQVFERLNGQDVSLHDLSVGNATLKRDPKAAPPEQGDLDASFAELENRLRGATRELALAAEIRMQLDLVDYFKKKRYQDAAYLMLDNVKRKLAYAAQNNALDIAMLNGSMARMEALEQDLKRDMPYTL